LSKKKSHESYFFNLERFFISLAVVEPTEQQDHRHDQALTPSGQILIKPQKNPKTEKKSRS
jgi:hypothetical protein